MSENRSDYLLDLQTDEPLPAIRIDGKDYALRIDVEYAELLRNKKLGERVQVLTQLNEMTEQNESELRELLRKSVRSAVKAPDAVLDKLTDMQRFQVIQVFGKQISEAMDPTTAGGNSSPVLGGSTAGQ